jgi:ABC-2 type transport system ATP-binding protein
VSQTVFTERPTLAGDESERPAIEIEELRKTYGNREVLHGLTLRVGPGEVFGFLGPNGAGKSTTMKILAGLVRQTSGDARIMGEAPADADTRRHLGYLPEQFRFHGWLTGAEVLRFHGRLSGVPSDVIHDRIPTVLDQVGLTGRGQERVSVYSKGMTQRIGIAQAILHQPEVLLLDEPTSALDPVGRREIRDLVRALAADGMTIFINSHLLTEIELTCDRVAIVDQGRVVRAGTVASLMSGSTKLRVVLDRIDNNLVDRIRQLGKVEINRAGGLVIELHAGASAADVAHQVVITGHRLQELTPVRETLEELFVSLVEGGDR